MGARKEQRTSLALPVRIWGMDASGVMFDVVTHTVDITPLGARIEGINRPLNRGSVVNVQCGTSKARFRVMWVGGAGSERQGQIGIRAIEIGRYIWGTPLPRMMGDDHFDSPLANEEIQSSVAPSSENPLELSAVAKVGS